MGQNYAIAIGINEYYNQRSLKYAERDAFAIRDYCLNEAGFNTVYYFSDTASLIETDYGSPLRAEPTYGNIQTFLRRRFSKPFLQAGDNLWFFFAGHGKQEGGRDYLLLKDSDPDYVERTGIAIRDLTEQLRKSGADNVILMLDACRNEDSRNAGGVGLEKQKGVITLFSCSPRQVSYEIDEIGHGVFTHSLLQALRIQGEGNCATIERLYQHLRYAVPAVNRQYGKAGQQMPYMIAEPATKLHLILLPHQATLADVQALKNDAFEAEAEHNNWELAEQLWIRVLAASPADVQAVKAIKRLARRTPSNSVYSTIQSSTTGQRIGLGSAEISAPNQSPSSSQNYNFPRNKTSGSFTESSHFSNYQEIPQDASGKKNSSLHTKKYNYFIHQYIFSRPAVGLFLLNLGVFLIVIVASIGLVVVAGPFNFSAYLSNWVLSGIPMSISALLLSLHFTHKEIIRIRDTWFGLALTLCSLILLFQGWQLNPILQLSTALLIELCSFTIIKVFQKRL